MILVKGADSCRLIANAPRADATWLLGPDRTKVSMLLLFEMHGNNVQLNGNRCMIRSEQDATGGAENADYTLRF